MSFQHDLHRAREAQRAVPRERFVPPELRARAGEDHALPIACGQTISQPSLVALMTAYLALTTTDRVLEIGTGSGYQTVILSRLAAEVFSIERIAELAEAAAKRLAELGCGNVTLRTGDGVQGWIEAAPFDAIILTAAPREIPSALTAQLRPGGRLVAPVGVPGGEQMLVLVTKDKTGGLRRRELLAVRFVPLISGGQA